MHRLITDFENKSEKKSAIIAIQNKSTRHTAHEETVSKQKKYPIAVFVSTCTVQYIFNFIWFLSV